MTKMDQFVKAMEMAFALSRELGAEGISSIDWSFTFYGTAEASSELKRRMDEALVNYAHGTLKEEAA